MTAENIEVTTYFGRCRCCFNYGYLKNMWCEHLTDDGESEIYGNMVIECFALSWEEPRDTENEQICSQCIEQLRNAVLFKLQIQDTDERFQQQAMEQDDKLVKKEEMLSDDEIVVVLDQKDMDVTRDSAQPGPSAAATKPSMDDGEYEQVEYLDEFFDVHKPRKAKFKGRKPKDQTETDVTLPRRKWPRKLPKADRYKTYKQYTEEAMKEAIEAAASERMTLQDAAEAYKVPVKTLKIKVRTYLDNPEAKNLIEVKQYKFVKEITTVLSYTNATPYKSKGIRYFCAYCGTDGPSFEDPEDLREHTRTAHAEDRIKRINFMIRPYWMNEILKLDIDNLACTVCGCSLDNWNHMFEHLKKVHNEELDQAYTRLVPYILTDDLTCALCHVPASNYLILDGHMNAHYNNYICGDCGDSYVTLCRLKQHAQIHDIGRFHCDHCGKVFNLKKYLKKHVDQVHSNHLRFRCRYCPEMFKGEYIRHLHVLEKHREKVKFFKCEYCGKVFDWRQYFSAHVRKIHLKDKKYGCELCDKKYASKYELKNHMKSHERSKFQCNICEKRFTTKVSCNNHMLNHVKQEPESRCYNCEFCNEKFYLKNALNEHMSLHVTYVWRSNEDITILGQ